MPSTGRQESGEEVLAYFLAGKAKKKKRRQNLLKSQDKYFSSQRENAKLDVQPKDDLWRWVKSSSSIKNGNKTLLDSLRSAANRFADMHAFSTLQRYTFNLG